MDKLDLQTHNFTNENIQKLSELFPNCVTENNDGKNIDFDKLKQELSSEIIAGNKERYHLNWPGKNRSILEKNKQINKTLRPDIGESKNFENTKNVFIEGDNLEVLKLLQETYLGKLKLIYIDPPYNTGRNLIYKNDFSETEKVFLKKSDQVTEDGERMVANLETNGKFHSDWLSMIYPRLLLSKSLLAEDGVLICAIDENELATLSIILKEIFNEVRYEHSYVSVVHNPRGQQGVNFSYVNDFLIFIYPSDGKKYIADFKKDTIDSRSLRDSGTESDRKNAKSCFYPFIVKNEKIIDVGKVPEESFHPASSNVKRPDGTIEIWPINDKGDEKKWRYANQSVHKIIDKLQVKKGRESYGIIFNKDEGTMRSVWQNPKYDASEYGTKLLDKLIGGASFTYPKSLWAVYDAIFASTKDDRDAIVMDFFAGSSTTAHAVMELNAREGGNRKFIMVQVPEKFDSKSKLFQDGFKNIADISKERIRLSGELVKKSHSEKDNIDQLDDGFRVLKVDSSNMKDIYFSPDETDQTSILDLASNIKEDRCGEDLLFMVLLSWGIDLSAKIEKKEIEGKEVYLVDDNYLAACFDENIDEHFVKKLIEVQPLKVVLRDSGFASSSVKINAKQIFMQANIEAKVI
jgi:adenine-specific DNA-methyltransferase